MQDINAMLGQAAPPEEETNPLEKIQEAGEEAAKTNKKDKQKGNFDPEVIKAIIAAGDNSDGLFEPSDPRSDNEEDTPKFEEPSKKAKITVGTDSNRKGKYISNFIDDAMKNPNDYKVQTPRGEMTVAEAMSKGYNPITKRFEKANTAKGILDKNLKDANEDDKKAIEALMDPKQLQLKGADADTMNLPKDSIMREAPEAEEAMLPPEMTNAAPPEEEPADLNALLGGIK